MNSNPTAPQADRARGGFFDLLGRAWRWTAVISYRYQEMNAFLRARLIIRLCTILIPVGVISLVSTLVPVSNQIDSLARLMSLIASAVLLIACILVIRWLQTGHRKRAEIAFTLAFTVASAATFFIPGFNSPMVLILTGPIIVSGFLFGGTGVFWSVLTMCVLAIARVMFDPQILSHQIAFAQANNPATFGGIITLFSLIVTGALLYGFLRVQRANFALEVDAPTEQSAIAPVITTVARYPTYQAMYEHAAEDLRTQLGYYYVQLFVYDPPSRLLVRAGQSGLLNPVLRQERRIALEDPHSAIAEAGRNARSNLITLTTDSRLRSEFLVGTRAELAVPMTYEGTLIGVLDVHSTQTTAFNANEITQLESIASLIAFALRQLKQADEASVSQDEQTALRLEIAQLRDQLSRVRRESVETDWEEFLRSQGRGDLSFMWTGKQVQPAPTNSPFAVPAVDSALLTAPQIRIEDGQQVLYVPIVVSGRPLGNMVFYASDNMRWDERSLVTASTIGQRFALLVENLRLIEEARSAELREKLINDVTAQLQAQTSLDALLATASDAFGRSMGAVSTRIQIAPDDRPIRLGTSGTGSLVARSASPVSTE